jgi:carbon-monoxide dehydrogenase medium subunit
MTVPGYHQPSTVEEAVSLLARIEGARCIAGGATLVAMMNADLVAPPALVSLRGIAELAGIATLPGGGLRIGAMTRHRETAAEARLSGTLAVLRAAARQIANPVVRNMGTIGGSIAFADAAADYPPALVAANAEIEIAGAASRRMVRAEDFFLDWYATALAPGEVVTAVVLPPAATGAGRYTKLARVAGDFAIASIALAVARRGAAYAVRVAVGGCGPRPVHLAEVDTLLTRAFGDAAAAREAGAKLAAACDPVDDVRASGAYRRAVVPRLLAATIAEAQADLAAG